MTASREHMAQALALSKLGRFSTKPNPMVGCVIVKNNQIIGEGWHIKAGENHAEVNAIRDVYKRHINNAQELLKGSEVYVTLEPCNKMGRTPPCTLALIEAGVGKVFISQGDVSQNGVQDLLKAGIEIELGLLAEEAFEINKSFFKRLESGKPFTTCKIASSLDGGIALNNGDSKWITSKRSREEVHVMRASSDAIITGVGTVLSDNPRLNARLKDEELKKICEQPLKCIVDSQGKMSGQEKILSEDPTIIFCNDLDKSFKKDSVEFIKMPGKNNKISLSGAVNLLGERGINSLMIEAGPKLIDGMLEEYLIDEFVIFIAPKILGAGKLNFSKLEGSLRNIGTIELDIQEVEVFGEDLKVSLTPNYLNL